MRRYHQSFLALLIALLAVMVPTAVALAQLPQFPNTFFGDVTINGGQPGPVGMEVTAVVERGVTGSEKRYTLTITELGKYGDPNGIKLKVGGDQQGDIADGSNIQFFLSMATLPSVIDDLVPVAEVPFFSDGAPHNIRLDLAGTISVTTVAATPPTTTPPTTTTTGGGGNDNDNDRVVASPTPVPTSTPPPATPTNSQQGGGGGQPTPTATPELVPPTEPVEPTPINIVVAPPQVPTATPEPTPEPTLTLQPTPTAGPPTPEASLVLEETAGGGGEEGGFPWWGWVLIVLGVGSASVGVAIYYLRT